MAKAQQSHEDRYTTCRYVALKNCVDRVITTSFDAAIDPLVASSAINAILIRSNTLQLQQYTVCKISLLDKTPSSNASQTRVERTFDTEESLDQILPLTDDKR